MAPAAARNLAALLLGVAFGSAEELNVYDRNGSYQGSVFDYGRSQTFTDQHGQFTGSSITHGNSTSFYDRSGWPASRHLATKICMTEEH